MQRGLSLEIYKLIEEEVGKEKAEKVAGIINRGLEAIEEKAKEVAFQKKLELKDELTNELVTKAEIIAMEERLKGEFKTEIKRLEGEIKTLEGEFKAEIKTLEGEFKAEIKTLEGEFKTEIKRLEGEFKTEIQRLDGRIDKMNMKLNFLIILMIIALTLMNPIAADLIKRLF